MRGARHLPVASNGLQGTIISSQGDVESDEVLAGLDVVEFLGRDASLLGCFVVEKFDLLQETRFSVGVKLWAELGGGSRGLAEGHC